MRCPRRCLNVEDHHLDTYGVNVAIGHRTMGKSR